MNRFEGKVVIVTGAGSGIGAATARRFFSEGASVVLNGRRKEKLVETAEGVDPRRVLIHVGDISDETYVTRLVEETIAAFGRLDVLVNNAGVAVFGPFLNSTTEQWRKVMSIDVDGVYFATRAALPHLQKTKGSIVNVSSVSGLGGDWGGSIYNAAKGAVTNLTRALALELGSEGVRVNAVNPSLTSTEMTADFETNEPLIAKFKDRLPIGRGAKPEEVAGVIAFLASDDAVFVNGVNLPVDGGVTASNGQPNMTGLVQDETLLPINEGGRTRPPLKRKIMDLRTRHPYSRRRFLGTAFAAGAAAALAPRSLFAQAVATQAELPAVFVQGRAAGAIAKITTKTLRRNVSVLMGSGGNIAVLTGTQGKLLVDSGYSTSRPQIAEALAALSPDPMTHLIDTHWHFDHTDGNEWMHAAGATILAHSNTKLRLSTPQYMAALNAHLPAAPAGAIPTQTFAATHTLKLNGETLHLAHYEPAHTDSDISIHFQEADVLHAGDTWFNGFYPFIDYSTGGSIDGMIAAAKRTLATVAIATIIIPGHGPIGDKAQLTAFSEMLVATRAAVAALKQQGRSIEETIAAKPTAPFDDPWGKGFMNPEAFTRLVYQGV